MPAILWVILLGISLFRILCGSLFPITADEAYYWLWSKHLALSYVDHPPLIAYINFFTTFGKENLFLLRLSGTLIALLISIILYFVAKKLFNPGIAFWSAILFQVIPHFFFIWLTMFVEIPLVLFWTLSLLIVSIILKENKSSRWYLLVPVLGLGYLSKYTMFLFWPCLGLCLLNIKEYRFWLSKKEPYLSFLLSLIFFVPVLLWNSKHNWISFTFHAGRASTEGWLTNFLPFIGEQLIHFSPFFVILLIPVLIKAYKEKDFLFYFSAPILILFVLLSLKVKIWPHWPSIGYIAAIPLTVSYLGKSTKKLFTSFIIFLAIFNALILGVLFWADPGILVHQKEYAQNYKLKKLIPPKYKIFAINHGSVSILEFYSKRPVYLMSGAVWGKQQFEIWGIPKIKKGETILYYGPDSSEFRKKFKKISIIHDLKLHSIEGYINNFKFFKLEEYRG